MLVEGKSFDELADHYFSNLAEQFGQAVELTDEFKWEWITVPHIYDSPFYTYSYSFGQLLVLALYQQYPPRRRRVYSRLPEDPFLRWFRNADQDPAGSRAGYHFGCFLAGWF